MKIIGGRQQVVRPTHLPYRSPTGWKHLLWLCPDWQPGQKGQHEVKSTETSKPEPVLVVDALLRV